MRRSLRRIRAFIDERLASRSPARLSSARTSRSHRRIYYFPTAGGSAWASLTPSQAWPKCYTAQLNNYASPWNTTLWFGGPGGSC